MRKNFGVLNETFALYYTHPSQCPSAESVESGENSDHTLSESGAKNTPTTPRRPPSGPASELGRRTLEISFPRVLTKANTKTCPAYSSPLARESGRDKDNQMHPFTEGKQSVNTGVLLSSGAKMHEARSAIARVSHTRCWNVPRSCAQSHCVFVRTKERENGGRFSQQESAMRVVFFHK